MKTTVKCKISEIKNLNLKGIEILEVSESSQDDMRSLTLKDTVTGTEFRLTMTPYSDFAMYVEKPPVVEKRYVVDATVLGNPYHATFKTRDEANAFCEANESTLTEPKVTEVQERVA